MNRNVIIWIGWGALALAALGTGAVSLRYLSFNPDVAPVELLRNLMEHRLTFFTHAIVASLALIIGVLQFLPLTRRSRWHRFAGRAYVACVTIGGVTGFLIAWTTDAGPVAGLGFATLAVLWLGVTTTAFLKARARDFKAHRVWMIRSFALTASAISLRLILPIGQMLGASFNTSYIVAAWACWIVNLAIAEFIIRMEPFRRTRRSRPAI